MAGQWLLYGAYGYTGELTARLAAEKKMRPILGGRDANQLDEVARRYGLSSRSFSLDDSEKLNRALEDVDVVLHCAGPFSHTHRAMSDACLRTKTHYLDITGELTVFESLARRDQEAKQAGVMLMPGVGFDVVPSDCLAAHLKRRLPDATHLALGFQGLGRVSRGTATTMAENMGRPGAIRKNGRIIPVPPGYQTRSIDFGRGEVTAVTIPWGDVSTAYYSTGIPNIEVYSVMPKSALKAMRWTKAVGWFFQLGLVQQFLKKQIRKRKPGPDDQERQRGASLLWGEVRNQKGDVRTSRLKGPEGYTLTALTSLAVVNLVLEGKGRPGFQTPSQVFGPDLILEIPGTAREDLD